MRGFSTTEVIIVITIVVIILAIFLPGLTTTHKNNVENAAIRKSMDTQPVMPVINIGRAVNWTSLGTPSDGGYNSASVLRATDPDTGATIYVMLGVEKGGIFVLPPQEKK